MYWNKLKADKMKKYESKQKKSEKRGQKKVNEVNIQINKLYGLCVVLRATVDLSDQLANCCPRSTDQLLPYTHSQLFCYSPSHQ